MRKVIQLPLVLLFLITLKNTSAEGSYELLKASCSNYGYLQIWDNADPQRNFATYDCPSTSRLNIRLNAGDRIYYGYATDVEDVYYRIKNPNGTVVKGPALITSASPKGWITNCTKAITGPDSLYAGGYKCLSMQAGMTGDYSIEFAVNNNATSYLKRIFLRFDITVKSGGVVKKGRVWSKNWDITTNGSNNAFVANLYVYTLDSVVTKIDFNGIKPHGFTVACNSYGSTDVGSLKEERKSNYRQTIITGSGLPGAPEYKIFLNDPDSTQFPTGSVGHVTSLVLQTCGQDTNCIEITVTKSGQVEIVLVFPTGPNITIVQDVNAGTNCVAWNGLDGNGLLVPTGTMIQLQSNYLRGITHLPMTDVENHSNGFIVSLLRPSKDWNGQPFGSPKIFWDDSLLIDPANSIDGVSNMNGCTGGCHKWTSRGTNNADPEVINTWWYISQQKDTIVQYCTAILALELTEFSAENHENQNDLYWKTSSEHNLDHFEIERSFDNIHFVNIGKVLAKSTATNYYFQDNDLSLGNFHFYYRLKIMGESGNYKYSPIVLAEREIPVSHEITTYPNPCDGRTINFLLTGIDEPDIEIKIITLQGRVVYKTTIQKNEEGNFTAVLKPQNQLQNGLYMLNCITEKEFISKGIIVK